MTTLHLTYTEYSTGGGVCAGQENDSWPDYEDEHVTFTPGQLFLDRANSGVWSESFEVPFEVERGDVLHVLVVRYGTGDTFSHTDGRWAIMGASKDPKVVADLAKRCDNDSYNGQEEGVVSYYYDGYAPWRGYFESFQGTEIHTFVVQ